MSQPTATDWARERRPHREYFSLFVLVGAVVCLICLAVFVLIAENVLNNHALIQLDFVARHLLRPVNVPWATRFFGLITLFGYQLLAVLGAAVALLFAWKRQRLWLVAWLIVLAGGALLNIVLKQLLAYPRLLYIGAPVMTLYDSFPSGHAIMAISAYGLLIYFLAVAPFHSGWRVFLAAVLLALILLVGFSRLYLGVHFLSDVLAGFAVGGCWLSFCITATHVALTFRKT